MILRLPPMTPVTPGVEEYRKALKGRTLASEARRELTPVLKSFHGQSIDVIALGDDAEPISIAKTLGHALVDAGWDVGVYNGSGPVGVSGMRVCVLANASIAAEGAAIALDSALRCAHFRVMGVTWSRREWLPLSWPLRGFADHGDTGESDIRLYIGTDPK